MKPQALAEKTRPILPLLCCPLCAEPFSLTPDSHSLVCAGGHCYDLSRKGYIHLAPSHAQAADTYHAGLFECRRQLFQQGFYAPVMEAIGDMIAAFSDPCFSVLDAGCGEGSYAKAIAERFPGAQVIGLDLSRDAIAAAAKQSSRPHWLVANVSRLPIRDHSLSVLLDVLTPADYTEFARVLQKDGVFLKVIPGKDYLAEVRAAVRGQLRGDDYDNERVLAHLRKHASLLERKTLRHTYAVTPEQAALFARMTPMTAHLSPESLESASFTEITIHLELALCRLLPA